MNGLARRGLTLVEMAVVLSLAGGAFLAITAIVRGVSDLFEGESFNGLDDNDNGFVDEPGLFFARQDAGIVVGLTLQAGGQTRSWITRVCCRN